MADKILRSDVLKLLQDEINKIEDLEREYLSYGGPDPRGDEARYAQAKFADKLKQLSAHVSKMKSAEI